MTKEQCYFDLSLCVIGNDEAILILYFEIKRTKLIVRIEISVLYRKYVFYDLNCVF